MYICVCIHTYITCMLISQALMYSCMHTRVHARTHACIHDYTYRQAYTYTCWTCSADYLATTPVYTPTSAFNAVLGHHLSKNFIHHPRLGWRYYATASSVCLHSHCTRRVVVHRQWRTKKLLKSSEAS